MKVIDNSGAHKVECIKVLHKNIMGRLGQILLVAIKEGSWKTKTKKGKIVRCVLVRTK